MLTVVPYLCILCGVWSTFKALKPGNSNSNDIADLLRYWIVYAVVLNLDTIFPGYLLDWIPFFSLAKCGAMVLLFLPGTKISSVIFANYLQGSFRDNENRISPSVRSRFSAGVRKLQLFSLTHLLSDVSREELEKQERSVGDLLNETRARRIQAQEKN